VRLTIIKLIIVGRIVLSIIKSRLTNGDGIIADDDSSTVVALIVFKLLLSTTTNIKSEITAVTEKMISGIKLLVLKLSKYESASKNEVMVTANSIAPLTSKFLMKLLVLLLLLATFCTST
jgi:hypothetical protein